MVFLETTYDFIWISDISPLTYNFTKLLPGFLDNCFVFLTILNIAYMFMHLCSRVSRKKTLGRILLPIN